MEDELGRERFAFWPYPDDSPQAKDTRDSDRRVSGVRPNAKRSCFIDTELPPYVDAHEEVTDKAFQSFKNVEEINRRLVNLSRLDNFDWQPPAIEAIARHRADPEFTLRFLSDLERLAYGLFLMRSDPSDRIRRYGRVLGSIHAKEDLFADASPLQLDGNEKKAVRSALDGDIYTVTRIRLPLLLRLDEMLSGGGALYNMPITVEHKPLLRKPRPLRSI
jgi:hypothetical protein